MGVGIGQVDHRARHHVRIAPEQFHVLGVLVHEATYTQAIREKIGPGPQHSSAKMVAAFARELKLPNLVLTHFSPRYHDLGEIEEEARSEYEGRLFLARDLQRYALDRHGELALVPD